MLTVLGSIQKVMEISIPKLSPRWVRSLMLRKAWWRIGASYNLAG